MVPHSRWHSPRLGFGLHYDLHASAGDTELGTHCSPEELLPQLQALNPDFVQTDCKGHAGYVSWFSQTPEASVPEKLTADALAGWRAATTQLGVPLHCHYSGIWDRAAGHKHPDWCAVPATPANGDPTGQNAGAPEGEKMCPRGPYLEELMIPQLLELIDRYDVNGFWIDGDLWAVEPCYCHRCLAAYKAETGVENPPIDPASPEWPAWWKFTLQSFEAFVTRYTQAVHDHRPGVLVCSNWLQTFRNPGAPAVPTDWISGDNTWVWGLDASRCEARFLSTRQKHWDIMLWSFYKTREMGDNTSPWTLKPPQMLMQEAAVCLAFGGAVQIYETAGVRDGRLVPWRIQQLAEVGRFVQDRWDICRGSTTIPQIAVLHSEAHVFSTVKGANLMWSIDTAPVQGAVISLLENHFGVDILDEWALLPRLAEFPVIVVPEREALSDEMLAALKDYVQNGGKLLVTGSASLERFGVEFLGATSVDTRHKHTLHVSLTTPVPSSFPLFSPAWQLLECATAEPLATLGFTPLLDDKILPFPAAIINQVGQGSVAYVPADLFRDFDTNRYPGTRRFVGELIRHLAGTFPIEVTGPTAIDVALRRQGDDVHIHLINRASGLPNNPRNGAIDEIPPLGPIRITMQLAAEPADVELLFESSQIAANYEEGELTVILSTVEIHSAVVIKGVMADG